MGWLTDIRAELADIELRDEVLAAITLTVIGVPQGVAYALIAGLPPAMGLYAGALPAVFGSLFRSSRHVVTGSTNAVSLLIGTSAAATMPDPVSAAITLALLVGLVQIGAGLLRLGALVDYISGAVVTGYITGAGVLIAVGQIPNLSGAQTLGSFHPLTLGIGLGTLVAIVGLRQFVPRSMAVLVAVGVGTVAAWGLGLGHQGLRLLSDLSPIPAGLPPFTVPALTDLTTLMPIAVAAAVLSLVESTSVARSIAARSGQKLDIAQEFVAQGAANVVGAFSGAYPVSGSLSRSGLNERAGGGRLSSVLSGVGMIGVLLALGPVVNFVPVASLAGLLFVVAWDLMDWDRIRSILHGGLGDRIAFAGTVLGTWTLPLDQAIYLGVGLSIVLFLRRASLLVVRELLVDPDLRLREAILDEEDDHLDGCHAIRILHIEGPLFFGAANELDDALRGVISEPGVQVVIVRLKRAQGLDYTVGEVLKAADRRLAEDGRTLLLVGMRPSMMARMRDMGVAEVVGDDHLYPTEPGWFVAMNHAVAHALALVGDAHGCEVCPLERYHEARHGVGRRRASVAGADIVEPLG